MWLPCRQGAGFRLPTCGTKGAISDAIGVPPRGVFSLKPRPPVGEETLGPLSHNLIGPSRPEKSSPRRVGMVQALHRNPVLWARRAPQERHGNGTQCGRATEGDKRLSVSEITRKNTMDSALHCNFDTKTAQERAQNTLVFARGSASWAYPRSRTTRKLRYI